MSDLEPCNKDIYEHDEVIHIQHMSAVEVEKLVEKFRLEHIYSDIDWHYVAGRAVFKALPNDWKPRIKIDNLILKAENALRVFKNYNRFHEASPGYDRMQDAMQELEDALKGN